MSMLPQFQRQIKIPVCNYITGEDYNLIRIDEIEASKEVLDSLVAICNEKQIYNWLFRGLLQGKRYTRENAKQFFKIGVNGWEKNTQYIFVLVTANRNIAAAIDIKSADLQKAEIGYWSSEQHRGCMTNTTKALLEIAGKAGYKSLFGRVKKGNCASFGVLDRCGFKIDIKESEAGEIYNYFSLDLEISEQASGGNASR